MSNDQPLKLPKLVRDFDSSEIEIRKEDAGPVRLKFAASSETPVERYFGEEILRHDSASIRLDRAKRGAMPLLFNHDMGDPIGMVDAARIEQGRLVVDAHLFGTERAAEIVKMLDGGLRNVSIGYRIYTVEEDTKKQRSTAVDWEPHEVSIVTVPADATVGIGRASAGDEFEVRVIRPDTRATNAATAAGESSMTDPVTAAAGASADQGLDATRIEAGVTAARQKIEERSALDLEQGRVRAIENLAKANKIPDNVRDAWVRQGYNLEQVSNDILKILEERGRTNPQPASRLGLSAGEAQRFSLRSAILAAVNKDWSKAGFELECSRGVAQKLGRTADDHRFYVPFEVLERPIGEGRRDLTAASAGAGGYLVETANVGFIEMLRNRSVVLNMGATRLSGLQGNVTVPRQSAAATAYWLANEAATVTESQQTFVQMSLTPKTAGAYTEISRQLLLQSSPAAESIVSNDLAMQVALAVDLAALEGSGASGQPTGLSNTAGIGSVTGTSLAAAGVIEFQTDVAGANVNPLRGGYVTTPAVAGLLMARPELPSTGTTRLWQGNIWDGSLFNLRAMTSNQLTAATMVFGDWAEMVLAEWGVLEVEVNPYANFQAGIVGVRALYSVDVGVRRPFAFSRATSIT